MSPVKQRSFKTSELQEGGKTSILWSLSYSRVVCLFNSRFGVSAGKPYWLKIGWNGICNKRLYWTKGAIFIVRFLNEDKGDELFTKAGFKVERLLHPVSWIGANRYIHLRGWKVSLRNRLEMASRIWMLFICHSNTWWKSETLSNKTWTKLSPAHRAEQMFFPPFNQTKRNFSRHQERQECVEEGINILTIRRCFQY